MSDQQDVLRSHAFDGDIIEFDNRLPQWWLWTFYLACIFSFFYWIHYHVLKTGPLSRAEFNAEMDVWNAEMAKRVVTDDDLNAKAKDPAVLGAGRDIFAANCANCHAGNGGGMLFAEGAPPTPGLGPNLTDKFWIHGGKPSEILKTITNGVIEKGMLAWGGILGPAQCQAAAVYVMSLRNTNVKGGKEPQGNPYEGN